MKYNTNQLLNFATEAMRDALRFNRPSWDHSVGVENIDLRGFHLDEPVDENLIDDIRDAYNAIHDDDIDTAYAAMLKRWLANKASKPPTQNKQMAPIPNKHNGAAQKKKVPPKKTGKPAPPTYQPYPQDYDDAPPAKQTPVEKNKPAPRQNSREMQGEAYKIGSTIYWPRKRWGWNSGTVLAVVRYTGKFNVTVELDDGTHKIVHLTDASKIHTAIPDGWTEFKAWAKNKIFGESIDNIAKNILKEAIIKTKIE